MTERSDRSNLQVRSTGDGSGRPPAPFDYRAVVRLTNAQVRRHLADAGMEISRWTLRRVPRDDLSYTSTPGDHRRYEPAAVADWITSQGLRPGPALQVLLAADAPGSAASPERADPLPSTTS